MQVIRCPHCGIEFELSEALTKDIEATVLAAEKSKHRQEMEKLTLDLEARKKQEIEEAKKAASEQAQEKLASNLQELREESEEHKRDMKALRAQLIESSKQLREATSARENAELEMEKRLSKESARIRDEAQKAADERQRLNIAARDKTISDLQKSLEEAQRKASQGSQQLQGEVMELDLEEILRSEFRDDDIEPVAKGTRGADILQNVKTPNGIPCGSILWEVKRTKNWADSWILKLKEDLRNAKANVPIIVTETMPKSINGDIGFHGGVWICRPKLALVLAMLLRKSLLDSGLQRTLAEDRGTKADALYGFVTSHEFVQQIEALVETFFDMNTQIAKERAQFTKQWAEREAQCQRLLLGTARIMGSMQGYVGQSAMPRIRGLEILESGAPEGEFAIEIDTDS